MTAAKYRGGRIFFSNGKELQNSGTAQSIMENMVTKKYKEAK